jgi:hypothetical protein
MSITINIIEPGVWIDGEKVDEIKEFFMWCDENGCDSNLGPSEDMQGIMDEVKKKRWKVYKDKEIWKNWCQNHSI